MRTYVILKAAATALIAAACAQGPLLISKSLWVAGKWASSEVRAIGAISGSLPILSQPPAADGTGADLAGPLRR